MDKPYRLGIDLGGTNLGVLLLDIRKINDKNHGVLATNQCPTRWRDGYEPVADDMAMLCRICLKEAGINIEEVDYAGIGSPGVIDSEKGLVLFSSNLNFQKAPIAEALQQRLNLPVSLANDANAAALGEARLGAAQGCRHAVVITLGTGVGGGVIVDGKILVGFNGGGGELGHHVIEAHGRICSCGRRGCWEEYSSAHGLLLTAKEVLLDFPASVLWQKTNETGSLQDCRDIFTAYDHGDSAAMEIIRLYTKMLGVGIINMINLFQPEVLAIGGGLGARSDLYIPSIQPLLQQEVFAYQWMAPTRLVPAALGNDAGLFGAALLLN